MFHPKGLALAAGILLAASIPGVAAAFEPGVGSYGGPGFARGFGGGDFGGDRLFYSRHFGYGFGHAGPGWGLRSWEPRDHPRMGYTGSCAGCNYRRR